VLYVLKMVWWLCVRVVLGMLAYQGRSRSSSFLSLQASSEVFDRDWTVSHYLPDIQCNMLIIHHNEINFGRSI